MKPIIDMHTHTRISLCCTEQEATLQNYLDKAADVGIQVLGISDHCWDKAVSGWSIGYQKQDVEWVSRIREEFPVDTHGIKLYIGLESEYCGMSDTLGITAESAKSFDYVLIPHSHTHMKDFVMPYDPPYQRISKEIEERMRAAFPEVSDRQIEKWMSMNRIPDIEDMLGGKPAPDYRFLADFLCESFMGLLQNEEFLKVKDVVPTFIAHPFIPVGYSMEECQKTVALISDDKFREMFTRMAQLGIGYDLAVYAFRRNAPEECQMFRLLRIAKECGVKFTFGTDAHCMANLEASILSADVYEMGGLIPEDLHPMIRHYIK